MFPESLDVSDKIVYKSAGDYIITLKLKDCKTNENRDDVFDRMYAKYRCDRAFVVDIINKFSNESIDSIQSDHDGDFIYISNEHITIENYDDDINNIYTRGIHYPR